MPRAMKPPATLSAPARSGPPATEELPTLTMADGTLNALKWGALVLMILDHANKWLWHGQVTWVFALGRLVAPTFFFILAYNLSRPGDAKGRLQRTVVRLAAAAAVASVPFAALNGSWWPGNVLWLLLAGVLVLMGWRAGTWWGRAFALLAFVVGGAWGEYFWPGLLTFLAAFGYCRRPTAWRLALLALATATLTPVNGGWWAMASIPVILGAAQLRVTAPRGQWVFYVAYPGHLACLWAVLNAGTAS